MDIFEFELRYRAYSGMSSHFSLWWDEDMIINLVRLAKGNGLDKKLQDVLPDELRDLTQSTYSSFKKEFLDTVWWEKLGGFTYYDYVTRLEYELKVIKEMWFNTYFLIVQDFIVWAKQHTIMVGPWRWSGAGSLLAWFLSITDVDPLIYGLLFERFLNPARISMPDFDIDFEDTLRDKVIRYVTERYGNDKVCAIGTYMQLATKAAFKDSARAMGMPFDKANAVSNLVTDASFAAMLSSPKDYPEFTSQYDGDDAIKRAVDLWIVLEGNLRQLWVHACGIIIAPDPVTTYTAVEPIDRMQEEWQDTMVVSQYDGKTLETIGLLKMDFLWLRNLSVIKNCIKIIRAKHKKEWKELPAMFKDFFSSMSFQPPLDDAYTYEEIFQRGNTTGIFQFEGSGMRRFLVQLKASDINDLVAMSALYRPGPIEFIPRYIARKHGEEEISYMSSELRSLLIDLYGEGVAKQEEKKLIEDLDPIMNITYGIAVYQEQLMFLVQSMAWFSLAEADILRRWIGKKIKEVIEQVKKEFIEKSKDFRNYKPETAQYIYEKMIEPAASYSFNKSHSVCYSLIAYQTGYLKAHYPVEFAAALLRSKEEDSDKLSFFIDEVKEQGISVLLPDVTTSFNHVAAIDDTVRLWFLSVKGIWYDVWEYIEQERENHGPYVSLENFLQRCDKVINKKSLEWLIKSGSLDVFGDRKTLWTHVQTLLEWWKVNQQSDGWLFGGMNIASEIQFDVIYETSLMEKIAMEYEVFKTFVSVHPFDGLYPYLKKYTFISQFKDVDNYGPVIMVCFVKSIQRARKKGFFVKVEDISGWLEIFVSDALDYKPFDVLLIHGYKWRSLSLEKITCMDLDELIMLAKKANKYDPSLSVFSVKAERKKSFDISSLYDLAVWSQDEGDKTDLSEWDEWAASLTSLDNHEWDSSYDFALPDELSTIHQLAWVVKECPGSIAVHVGAKEYLLSDEWLKKVQALLG